ncbi:hypothetical protein LU276_01225 [Moraxella haemolytica]|uniref:hypothetical protein n=1 Tax=Moraxella haemolytica TaxID=2904119 RepID=UPI0025432BEE|nr:hypothetical protein [Moraxella sp. ZY171148]WII95503.1 hypothetical protein LU276_01225 [Moraxella sp. ZY171148]
MRAKKSKITKKLASLPPDAHGQEVLDLKQEIRKNEEHLKALKSVDKNAIMEADKQARRVYNKDINKAYYTSSKFLKNAGQTAISQGFRMGARQAIGLILAEIWFELRKAIPDILKKC